MSRHFSEICCEFYKNFIHTSAPTAMIVSSKEISLKESFVKNEQLPLKKGVAMCLAYSEERESFYLRIELQNSIEKAFFYLEIDKDIRSKLIPSNGINRRFLDSAIEQHGIRAFFTFVEGRLKLFAEIMTRNSNWRNYKIAIDEEVLDKIFSLNPNIETLTADLSSRTDQPIIREILPFLQHGLLNSARETLLTKQEMFRECDPKLIARIIRELFGRRGIKFRNKKMTMA